MKQAVLTLAVVAVYVLHQDIWFWGTPHPLVFGFLPIGLFYHAGFTVGAAGLMWALVKYAWPSHLERTDEPSASRLGLPPRQSEDHR